ncbi:Diacylglycerol kinase zeta [Echinococcus granulosus]|uniref:Diacylglycerol kinase zeta n=1 Tax=Echinococcus granulosus TaxID=6210 RepID=W6UJC2_ECHGR|nr:Diacylglycerol kinase zeta [Echinococcus granulosus]EUB58237.1 Diacylglycerol kinase zeta [Echinococcus granulosus]
MVERSYLLILLFSSVSHFHLKFAVNNSNDTGNNSATSWSISMPKWTILKREAGEERQPSMQEGRRGGEVEREGTETDGKPDCHLWYDTAASGEYCYVSDSQCTKAGPRKKCSSCRIICHTACIPRLDAKCKPTFRRAVSSTYRNKNDDQDTLYMQCSWCHLCYHNKPECFDSSLLTVSCQFGKHAKLIIPPTWIVKMPNEASHFSPSVSIFLEWVLTE